MSGRRRDPSFEAPDRGVTLKAVTQGGGVVAHLDLTHGVDPGAALAALGWNYRGIESAVLESGRRGPTIRVTVDAAAPHSVGGPAVPSTRLSLNTPLEMPPPGAAVTRRQRLAAYAVVISQGRLLATQLSAQAGGAMVGAWTLPGGGVDDGEDPEDGLRREVWEETGQRLGEAVLIDLLTSHWIGRAPGGEWEDYQVVRLIYRATVPQPGPLLVHDVGGTTAAAEWVDLEVLAERKCAAILTAEWLGRWVREA